MSHTFKREKAIDLEKMQEIQFGVLSAHIDFHLPLPLRLGAWTFFERIFIFHGQNFILLHLRVCIMSHYFKIMYIVTSFK